MLEKLLESMILVLADIDISIHEHLYDLGLIVGGGILKALFGHFLTDLEA